MTSVPPPLEGHPKAEIPYEVVGPAGEPFYMQVVTQFENDTRTNHERVNDSSPRTFRMSARLEKSHDFNYAEGHLVIRGAGSSFLTGNEGFTSLTYDLPEGTVYFHKNEKGEYSFLEMDYTTVNYHLAREIMSSVISFILDNLSFVSNCPIILGATRIEDLKNQVIYLSGKSPFKYFDFKQRDFEIPTELKPVYALYREALNSTSDFYKFLCLYKILEGIYNVIKPVVRNRMKACGLNLSLKDFVPHDTEIPNQYRKYCGRPVREFYDEVLTSGFRNAIAHFANNGAILNTSNLLHAQYFTSVIQTTQLCVREVIQNMEIQLSALHKKESGEVV